MRKLDWIMSVLIMAAMAGVMVSLFTDNRGILGSVAFVMVSCIQWLWIETSRLNRRIEALERATRPSATPADLP